METKLVSWSLIVEAIVLVVADLASGLFGILQFALPIALLALGIDLLGQKSPRKPTLALAAVAAVLVAVIIVRRLAL